MKKDLRKSERRCGFSIIEMMTVILVISLIIGILVPGVNLAKRYAREVRQRAQLYSIKSSLEMFYNDYDDYPPSEQTGTSPDYTCGAQKLAEALVGCDLQGYDPVSNFDLIDTDNNPRAYAIANPEKTKSLERRMGPYLQADERTGAYDIEVLFGSGGTGELYPGGDPENKEIGPVLCDTFAKKEISPDPSNPRLTVMAGAPILYYRVSRTSNAFDISSDDGNIYNYRDNRKLIELGNMRLPLTQRNLPENLHHFSTAYMDIGPPARDGKRIFYDAITNPVIKVGARPYNPETYILISAGYDGIYGTEDDMTNFGK